MGYSVTQPNAVCNPLDMSFAASPYPASRTPAPGPSLALRSA